MNWNDFCDEALRRGFVPGPNGISPPPLDQGRAESMDFLKIFREVQNNPENAYDELKWEDLCNRIDQVLSQAPKQDTPLPQAGTAPAPEPENPFRKPVGIDDARNLARLRGEIDYPEEPPLQSSPQATAPTTEASQCTACRDTKKVAQEDERSTYLIDCPICQEGL